MRYLQRKDKINGQEGRVSVYTQAMALFRLEILRAAITKQSSRGELDLLTLLEVVLLDMIEMERRGELIDRTLVRACCFMLEHLYEDTNEDESTKLYLTSFEPKFIESSRLFYFNEGRAFLANGDAGAFCAQARRRLKEEEERCRQTISSITEPKIKSVIDKEFILAHIKDVINMEGTGVKNMLDNDKIQDLANLFGIVSRVDTRKVALKQAVQKRVVDLGEEVNKTAQATLSKKPQPRAPGEKTQERSVTQQTQAALDWVEQVLQLKIKYDNILERAFSSDPIMEKALEQAFQDFIAANDRSPEHVSLFLDEYLKRGIKDKTEAQVDVVLDKGILLLQYLNSIDQFETYYRKHLAKRLLMKRSVSRDMERQMLSKMKLKLGSNITQKLEGMIKDMELSDNMGSDYRTYVTELGASDTKRVDIDARILTTNQWPFETLYKMDKDRETQTCKYPASVEKTKQLYTNFYLSKHTGRRLTWAPHLGDADIRATFGGTDGRTNRYELNVPTYAMVILMLYNEVADGVGLTMAEIEAETNIPHNEVVKTLTSLCQVPKWRVLKKEPAGKELLDTDKFFFNSGFTSRYVKIKIAAVVAGANKLENDDERKETRKRIDDERGHAIEAAIVRIMKQRKELTHTELITEAIQQLSQRFQPDLNMVKRKIEALIDREYLERGPDESRSPYYIYLA
jgi:cullin 3